MTWVAVAIGGSALIGAGVGIYSANQQAEAAEAATQAQTEASEAAIEAQKESSQANLELQKELANYQREDLQPWRDQGMVAMDQLLSGINEGRFTADEFKFDFKTSPGYQFRMDEGIKALDRSASARGRLQSGAQQKAITNYAQNVASDEYGRAHDRAVREYMMNEDRKVRDYNILSGLSSQGQAAAAGQAGATSQLASTSGNILANLGQATAQGQYNIGQAQAQGAYAQGNAWSQGAQNVGQAAQQGVQNWMTYQYLNQ